MAGRAVLKYWVSHTYSCQRCHDHWALCNITYVSTAMNDLETKKKRRDFFPYVAHSVWGSCFNISFILFLRILQSGVILWSEGYSCTTSFRGTMFLAQMICHQISNHCLLIQRAHEICSWVAEEWWVKYGASCWGSCGRFVLPCEKPKHQDWSLGQRWSWDARKAGLPPVSVFATSQALRVNSQGTTRLAPAGMLYTFLSCLSFQL